MARKKAGTAADGPSAQTENAGEDGAADSGSIPKKEMVARAIQHLGRKADRTDIQDFIRREFNTEMTLTHISSTKSQYLSGKGKGKGKRGKRKAAAAPSAANGGGPAREEGLLRDMRILKELIDRLGLKKFNSMVELLAPRKGGA
jgi:hypothetical protein